MRTYRVYINSAFQNAPDFAIFRDSLSKLAIRLRAAVPAVDRLRRVYTRSIHAATPQRLVLVKCAACRRTMDEYHERLPLFRPSPIVVRTSLTECRRCATPVQH